MNNPHEAESVVQYPKKPTRDLLLDVENPRLADYGLDQQATQDEILQVLWDRMAVAEVAMSIAWNGYFPHEPLFIEQSSKGLVVIEGNRRLAAVKLLLDGKLRKRVKATDLPDIDRTPKIPKSRRAELETLPVQVTTREDIWRYLGFKHVNGPATWGAYAKAKYAARVHHDYSVSLEQIALQIGDYNNTVERQYHGLMVVEQAERKKVFNRNNTNRGPSRAFEFSHIYEGLSREGIQAYLGLTADSRPKRDPVPLSRIKQLGMLLEWIYGDRARGIEPRMKRQADDLKLLSAALVTKEGVRALENGLSIQLAHDAAIGDTQLLKDALHKSKQGLQDALGLVTTGFLPDDTYTLSVATDIQQLAGDVLQALNAKRRRPRGTTEPMR